MESRSSLPFLQKPSGFLIKLLQRHVDGTFFGPSTVIFLPALISPINIWMRILIHYPHDQMTRLECYITGPLTSRRTLNPPRTSYIQIFLLRDTLIYLYPVQISVPYLLKKSSFKLFLSIHCHRAFFKNNKNTTINKFIEHCNAPVILKNLFRIQIPTNVQLFQASTMPQYHMIIGYIIPSNATLLRIPAGIWKCPFVILDFMKHRST